MSIKSVAGFYGKIIDDGEVTPEMMDEALEQMKEFQRYAKLAESVLLERVEEKDFVRFMLGVQKGVVAAMASSGELSILLADQDNSLKAYTHTVVLSVIGALIEDEIL